MARKNLKWQVHEAIMDSELPPPARLLMFVFADLASAETGEIPEERKEGTTLAELARRTGLGVATVKRHKPTLVSLGWLNWDEPDGKAQSAHDPGSYTIAIGRNPEPEAEAQSEPPPGAQSEPPQEGENEQAGAQSEPPGSSERAPGGAQSEPPIEGITNTDKSTDSLLGPNADASAPSSAPKKRTGKPKTEAPPRADVDALCQRLAELMIANECKPPTISKAWHDAARLMLDADSRDFDKAMHLLDWSQQNKFWRKNILSMPKFREKYDQLRLDALAEWEGARDTRKRGGYQPYDDPTDPDAYSGGIQ